MAIKTTGPSIRLAYGDIPGIDLAPALTFSWWWLPGTAAGSGQGVLGKGSTQPCRIIVFASAGALCFQGTTATPNSQTAAASYPAGTLVHAAIVFDGSIGTATARAVFYKNGAVQATSVAGSFGTAMQDGGATVVTVGYEAFSALAMDNTFACLRIWAAALTLGEIQAEMWAGRARRTANLLLDCPYDDGILATDYGPLKNPVTVTGTPTAQPGPPVAFPAAAALMVL